MTTVHIIVNAHLDPIWLWPWPVGLDSALATCRSACDTLDRHPEVIYSRGEAWVYDQVERIDPELFARIRQHVADGRWEIVGGWWIQPDCNLPGPRGFAQQIALGQQYFRSRFGQAPQVAYNVDSFGHTAGLPGFMRAAGQHSYVMMRPQEHELSLPARVFRWRGWSDGPEVTVFRIAGGYCGGFSEDRLRRCLTELPEGLEHTMFFIGAGDHGGGATEAQLAALHEHWNAFDGVELQFSSPSRFFAAIGEQHDRLPLVTGELQYHAIGCYTVHRAVKTGVRRAEERLSQAEVVLGKDATGLARLKEGWRAVCFHQFHDTLGGTCLPTAYTAVHDQLGGATALADQLLHTELRRRVAQLGDDPHQRLVLLNASERAFDDYVAVEAWVEGQPWASHWRLLDETGREVPFQNVEAEPVVWKGGVDAALFRLALAPGEQQVLRMVPLDGARADGAPGASVVEGDLRGLNGLGVSLRRGIWRATNGRELPLPEFHLVPDPTDTWSHGIDRYAEEPTEQPVWGEVAVLEEGPLRAALQQCGRVGDSRLRVEWRVYADLPLVDLIVQVNWRERHQVLKLVQRLPQAAIERHDGVSGGVLRRPLDGAERPVRDFVQLVTADGDALGVVGPDVYALDATAERLRLTLLRSPLMAHHDPQPPDGQRAVVADQGAHEFRFRFLLGAEVTAEALADHAAMLQRPPLLATTTRGMPCWPASPKL